MKRFGDTGGMNTTCVGPGKYAYYAKNNNFVGASRPRYAAVNYAQYPNGPVGDLYGQSVLVLHDWLKDHATYCAGDSFAGWVNNDKICTRAALGSLIAWAPEKLLDHLVSVVFQGSQAPPLITAKSGDTGGMLFMEAHLYQEVLFGTCVKALHLSHRETGGRLAIQKHASDFCRRNGILLRYVG